MATKHSHFFFCDSTAEKIYRGEWWHPQTVTTPPRNNNTWRRRTTIVDQNMNYQHQRRIVVPLHLWCVARCLPPRLLNYSFIHSSFLQNTLRAVPQIPKLRPSIHRAESPRCELDKQTNGHLLWLTLRLLWKINQLNSSTHSHVSGTPRTRTRLGFKEIPWPAIRIFWE